MKTIYELVNTLQELFDPLDQQILTNTKTWALSKRKELKEFRQSEEYKAVRKNAYVLYPTMYELVGGKTWYGRIQGSSEESLIEIVEKHCRAVADSRNSKIANKLEKLNIKKVTNSTIVKTSDGFNGMFVLDTDAGVKTVTINTVCAGGFNVQCLHLRVLTKIR